MSRFKNTMRNAGRVLLALAVVALAPAALEAAGIGFRNETPHNIYVQGSHVVNGQVKRGPLLLVKPGQIAWDVNLTKGPRTITVYDASNRVLITTTMGFDGVDLFFAVQPAPAQPNQPPRVKLKETPVPKMK